MMTEHQDPQTRRAFLTRTSCGLGAAAFAQLFAENSTGNGVLGSPTLAPKAKRIIYLHMSGGPSQLETFDPKPGLKEWDGKPLPDSVRGTQRLTTMTSGQGKINVMASQHQFGTYGQSGQAMNVLFKEMPRIADDICMIRSLHTEPINHDPAVTCKPEALSRAGPAWDHGSATDWAAPTRTCQPLWSYSPAEDNQFPPVTGTTAFFRANTRA